MMRGLEFRKIFLWQCPVIRKRPIKELRGLPKLLDGIRRPYLGNGKEDRENERVAK